MTGWRERDHTRGSLTVSLLVLALPLLASSLAMAAFQLVDLTFISRLGEEPMASVVIVNQTLRQTWFMLVMGSSFATQALIAGAIGAGRMEEAEHVAGQALALAAMFSVALALLGGLAPGFLFSLPGPDPSFVPYGVPYVQLIFLLNFGAMGAMFFGSILGGAGDTTTPLLVSLVQASVAIAAEWVLIFGNLGAPALGVRGVALGIACGQVAAMALGMTVLFSGRARVHLRGRHLVPDPATMLRIARLSWPPALQMAGGVAVLFVYLRLAGSFGEDVQAAYAVGLRLSMIVPMVCFPLATACATLVGQSLGADKKDRAFRAVRVGLAVHCPIMWSFAIATFVFRAEIVALFSDEPEVIRVGANYLAWTAGSMALWAFYFIFLRSLQGAGDFLVPMVITLASFLLIGIPLAWWLATQTSLGPTGIWIAQLGSTVFSTTGTGLRLLTGRFGRPTPHSAAP